MKYLIDLDGTLLNNTQANADAVEFIARLQKEKRDFLIMTNSIKSPDFIASRLAHVGMNVDKSTILNPISAINSYMQERSMKKAFIIGTELEISQVCVPDDKNNPDIILLLDFEKGNIGYNTLQHAFVHMQKGIPAVTASYSPYYIKDSTHFLDTGAFVRLLESAAEVNIKVLGKPSIEYFSAGISRLGGKSDEILVIGDDWCTNITGANNTGCKSALFTGGKYKKGDEFRCPMTACVRTLCEALEIQEQTHP